MPGRAPAPSAEYLAARERNRSDDKQTRSYRVVGPRSVYGADPGSVVELELSEGQHNSLVEAGHIALAEVEEAPLREEEAPPFDQDEEDEDDERGFDLAQEREQ